MDWIPSQGDDSSEEVASDHTQRQEACQDERGLVSGALEHEGTSCAAFESSQRCYE